MRAARRTPDGRPRSGRRRSFRTHSVPTGRPAAAPHRTGTPRTKPQEPRGSRPPPPRARPRTRRLDPHPSGTSLARPRQAVCRRFGVGTRHGQPHRVPRSPHRRQPRRPGTAEIEAGLVADEERRGSSYCTAATAGNSGAAAASSHAARTGRNRRVGGTRYRRRRADSCGASGRSGRTHRLEARHPGIATSALRSGYIHVGCTRRFVTLASRSPHDRPGALLLEPPLFECLNNTNAT